MNVAILILSAIILFGLRVAIIVWGGQLEAPGGDPLAFYDGAQQLTHSSSEWLKGGGEFGYRAPMYFVYLAAVFELVPNATFLIGQIATALLGVINCILIFALIRNLYGNSAGTLGFWLRGLLPSFVVADTFVMSEPLFATFLLAILLTISKKPDQHPASQAIVLGFLVACCLLTREVAIVYPIIFGCYLFITSPSQWAGLKYVALFSAALVIILAPWMWRNTFVWGQPFPISYTSGVNLHIGNNPEATGKWIQFSSESGRASRGFGTPQSDTWHRNQALKYIQEHPIRFLQIGFKKLAWSLWPRFEREEIKELYKLSNKQATLVSGLVGIVSASFMIAGIVGFVFAKRDWFWWVSLTLIIYTTLVTFIVFGSPRQRDAIDYLLLAFTVSAMTRWRFFWVDVQTKGSWTRGQIWILVPVLSYILINWMWIGYDLAESSH